MDEALSNESWAISLDNFIALFNASDLKESFSSFNSRKMESLASCSGREYCPKEKRLVNKNKMGKIFIEEKAPEIGACNRFYM